MASPSDVTPVIFPPAGLIDPASGGYLVQPDTAALAALAADPQATTPAAVVALQLTHPVMPTPVPGVLGRPDPAANTPTSVGYSTLGWVRVVTADQNGSHDVTFLRGVPVEIVSITESEPFGWATASLRFPSVSPFEDHTQGDPAKLGDGFDIDITVVDETGAKVATLFEGFIVEREAAVEPGGAVGVTITATGALYSADQVLAKPEIVVQEKDLGTRIFERLNTAPSPRYEAINQVSTGISDLSRGNWSNLLTGYVQDLLATATTADGQNQWTIGMNPGRLPVVKLKDRTTVHHAVTLGTPGVSVRLHKDVTQSTTTLYGYGVDDSNRAFGNIRLPNRDQSDDNAAFPFTDASRALQQGDTDNGTDSGDGVSVIQRRLRRAGYAVEVTGTFNIPTRKAVEAYQASQGLTVTGTVSGQTWTWMFTGDGGGANALAGAYYAPFSTIPEVERNIHNTSGQYVQDNPAWDVTRVRVERWRAFPDGTSKFDAVRAARAEIARDSEAGWTGTIGLQVDPDTTTGRWGIRAGENIRVDGWEGGSLLLHIASVSRASDGTVTLDVDSKARDLLTLDAIERRDRVNTGPARRAGLKRRSETPPDTPVIDSEIAGWIDDTWCTAGEWTIRKVPVGNDGNIINARFNATIPTRFSVAMFAKEITPATLTSLVANPLMYRVDGLHPFPGSESTADTLLNLGFLTALGGPEQAAGFWPGQESNGDPVTGKHRDLNISIPFESQSPPWVWLAFWVDDDCFIDGRLDLAPRR